MSEKDNGGAAFPTPWAEGTATEAGMSLRDYIAIKVLASAISSAHGLSEDNLSELISPAARVCYKIADIMIEERNK